MKLVPTVFDGADYEASRECSEIKPIFNDIMRQKM